MNEVINASLPGRLLPMLFAILTVAVLTGFVLMIRFSHILRKRHPGIYEDLQRPRSFLNVSIINRSALLSFLLSDKFREINDPALLRLGGFLQVFFYIYLVLCAAFAVLGVFSIGAPQ